MKIHKYLSLILLLPLAIMTGCGGGGDSAAPTASAPASVVTAASKVLALANSTDTATITANVTTASGAAAPDGTPVTFSVPAGTGTLSATTATTTNGVASVTVKHDPVTGATPNQVVTVTCTAGGATSAKDVKFINQPTKATVSCGTKRAVPNLAALDMEVDCTAGATFNNATQPIAPANAAAGSLVAAKFTAGATQVSMINATGVNTGTAPIMTATFDVVAAGGLPTFSVNPAAITATDPAGTAITPPVTASDVACTAKFDTE